MDKNYLLHKYLNGEATESERQQLIADPAFASFVKVSDASAAFEVDGFKEDANLSAIREKQKNIVKVRSLNPYRNLLRIAAVVAVVALSYVFLVNRTTTITTDIAGRENFVLPDQSEVQLNAQSEISYSKKGWEKERHLTLNGEAYFKVEKGGKFEVETPLGTVAVLGTQFNVFSRNDQFYVKCFEGLVQVQFADTLVKLPAGTYLQVANNNLVSYTTTTDRSPSWIAFESNFQNVTLETVLNELKRQYPIEVDLEAAIDTKFTGSFTHKDLDIALRSICEPLQLEYIIAGGKVTIYAKNGQ